MAQQVQNQFNFDAFNQLKKTAPAGLKIFLAQQLMDEVLFTATRYRNPLRHELSSLCDEIADFRDSWKKAAAARERNDSSIATAHIDNLESMKGFTNSADGGKVDQAQAYLANVAANLLARLEALEKSRDEDKEDAMQLVSDTLANMELMTGNSAAKAPAA